MTAYELTPRAKSDIFEIWSFIAERNETAADLVEAAILEACALIGRSPFLGHSRQDLTIRNIRFWTVTEYGSFTIAYRPDTAPVQVIAVLHGKRDVPAILKDRTQ
jgi:plasmid stabilization system protein ParE